MIHALESCPGNDHPIGKLTLQAWEESGGVVCPYCGLDTESLGSVAQASGHISNGYEYFYNEVADCAREYNERAGEVSQKTNAVKSRIRPLLDSLGELFKELGAERIHITPPGSHGSVALVMSTHNPSMHELTGLSFGADEVLSARVAIAGAGIAQDSSEADTLIADLVAHMPDLGIIGSASGAAIELFSSALVAYNQGIESIANGIESILSSIPLVSLTGLGTWAKSEFLARVKDCGLEPFDLTAAKPVLVNTAVVIEGQSDPISGVINQAKEAFHTLDDEIFAQATLKDALVSYAANTAEQVAEQTFSELIQVDIGSQSIATFHLPAKPTREGW